jgi:hypothetical protein
MTAGQTVLIRVAVEEYVPHYSVPIEVFSSTKFRFQVVPEADSAAGAWIIVATLAGLVRRRS